jgi:hypothetical protein
VKNDFERALSLFIGAEKSAELVKILPNPLSKTPIGLYKS